MSARSTGASRRVAAAAGVLIVSIVSGSCGNSEVVQHGARYSSDNRYIIATGREPACGCLTLRNMRTQTPRPLFLESRLFGIKTGEQVLQPGESVRVQFDWAGPQNSDVYVMSAYDTLPDDSSAKDVTKGAQDVLDRGRLDGIRDLISVNDGDVETTCNETCEFGPLGMNNAYNARLGQNKVESHEVGVHMTKNGHVIEAVASTAEKNTNCGCMMLRNITERDVVLSATLHGVETGRMTLRRRGDAFIAYDNGGGRPDDVYAIAAVSVDRMTTTAPPGSAKGAGGVRLQDYVRIVGQLDQMECIADGQMPGARFKLPASDLPGALAKLNLETAVIDALKAPAVTELLTTIMCPFASADGSLGLSVKALAPKAAASGAPEGGQTPPTSRGTR